MKLSVGMPAPAFEIEDMFGNPVALKSYAGKMLLLSFFRTAACALCNLQLHRLIQRYPEYQAQGLEIVAVFESQRESILKHVSKQSAPFPIVADAQAVLYDLYGVETSEEKAMAPVDAAWRSGLIRDAEAIGYPLTPEGAMEMLTQPGVSVTEVAYAAGFESISAFNSGFRRFTQETPTQYRNRFLPR